MRTRFSAIVLFPIPYRGWTFFSLLMFVLQFPASAESPVNDRIGLTLSGGGAKGFAHIGVLHVIDSLGLELNYISGTSMGSVVGGLYAAGYSAADIEKIALSIDWTHVFDPNPKLENIHVRNRYESGKYLIEIPFEKLKVVVGTGAIEGQHLWSRLEALFFHLRETKNFCHFPTPFACVATNIETGKPVVMSSGDIVSAIRASIAIPAVFTAVERDGMFLLDGGSVNNFPVDVVKEMGAVFVIGVNVSHGLRKAEELNNPFDIIYQMGLFKNADVFEENRKNTDLYIFPDLDDYDASDFTQVADIIERGKQMARNFLPQLKELAEKNPTDIAKTAKSNQLKYIEVDHVFYHGLKNIRENFLSNIVHAYLQDTVTAENINTITQRLYATGYFDQITYTFRPSEIYPAKKLLTFTFREKPMNLLKLGLHYNDFKGVGLAGAVSAKKLFLHNLYGDFSFSLGRQPAYRAKIDFFTSEYLKNWICLKTEGNVLNFPYKEDFVTVAAYKKNYFRLDASFNQIAGKNSYLFTGVSYSLEYLDPTIQTDIALDGKNSANEIFAGFKKYSLDRHAFSNSGHNLSVKTSWVLNQKPSFNIVGDDENVSHLSQTDISISNFIQLEFCYEYYLPILSGSSFFTRYQAGYNYKYTQGFLNMFNLGGSYSILRNQIVFPGIDEYGLLTPSVITAELGWHMNIWSDFYFTPIVGAALYDFNIELISEINVGNMLLGTSLSLGYLSPLGPISATISYSPQKNRVLGNINIGWSF